MEKTRYNRTFKKSLTVVLFCVLLFGTIFVLAIIAKVQYDGMTADMRSVEATIVDIDLDIIVRGLDEQELYVTYEVDGVSYSRELKTDTPISFAPGKGANYSVGDKLVILYDPSDPQVIASPRSVGVGYYYMAISLVGTVIVMWVLCYLLSHSGKYRVTQAEYEKEGVILKKLKADKKEYKKKKYAKEQKALKIVWIVLGAAAGVFALYLLFGALLMALGY